MSESWLAYLARVRKWQLTFAVHCEFGSLPMPRELVYERQVGDYRQDGRNRFREAGGQLVVTVKGRGGLALCGGKPVELRAGDAFLHNHRDPDVCYFLPAGAGGWEFLWISFAGAASEQLISEINRAYGYLFRLPLDSGLVPELMELRRFGGTVRAMAPLAAAEFALRILASAAGGVENDLRMSPSSRLAQKAQELIESNPGEENSIGLLATRLGVSREHLARVFRERTGMTLRGCLAERRLCLGRELLSAGEFSVKEVAQKCGFGSQSGFCRAYRRRFGSSPGGR
ncbi:MAG: AraC family transcriptional regulator [Victivallaceae bacterium]|nr:AraC family transcriptional regulator [Victivallaceae bacterium]